MPIAFTFTRLQPANRVSGSEFPALPSAVNVTCPGCGCLCDDVRLTIDGHELHEFEPGCELGRRWFQQHLQPAEFTTSVDGISVSHVEAVRRAVELLRRADNPLIYGLSRSATPGQRAAVALADHLGAVIDSTASLCHGPSIMALQEVGEVTCTLGEVRNRADLVIFWGCHPAASHPRHAERYSVSAAGRFTRAGRASRRVVMIGEANHVHDWKLSPGGEQPDLVIPVEADGDFELIAQLRCILREGEAPAEPLSRRSHTPSVSPPVRQLVELIRASHYGIVFFGLGLSGSRMWEGNQTIRAGHVQVAALLQLVAELNAVTRFTARRMRMQGDVSGADNVLLWQTGYPFAVDFSRGYPRYNPGEFSANEVLERGEADACVLVGAETIPYFSPAARAHLRSIPTIVLDYPGVPLEFTPTVRFTTAVYGLHAAGTAYRMDNVPLPLQAICPSDLPTDEAVLTALANGCTS